MPSSSVPPPDTHYDETSSPPVHSRLITNVKDTVDISTFPVVGSFPADHTPSDLLRTRSTPESNLLDPRVILASTCTSPSPRLPRPRTKGRVVSAPQPGRIAKLNLQGSRQRPIQYGPAKDPSERSTSMDAHSDQASSRSVRNKCSPREENHLSSESNVCQSSDARNASYASTEPELCSASDHSGTSETTNRRNPIMESDPSNDSENSTTSTSVLSTNIRDVHEVYKAVRQTLIRNVSPDKAEGRLYIFRDLERPGILKIGSSGQSDPDKRLKEIKISCNMKGIEEVYVSPNAMERYRRAEKLAQDDLRHLWHPYLCSVCTKKPRKHKDKDNHGDKDDSREPQEHREWFEVDEELAIKTVQRWEEFIQQKPYTLEGQLKPIWHHLVSKRIPIRSTNTKLDHITRWQNLDQALTPPTLGDYLEQMFPALKARLDFMWMFSWQIYSMASWMIIFCTFQNAFSFLGLFISVSCSGIRICEHCLTLAPSRTKGRVGAGYSFKKG